MVAKGAINLSPAEAFIFGASVLIHDSAMSLAAYPNGISDIITTTAWKDAVAAATAQETDSGGCSTMTSDRVIIQVLPGVLRQLHAEHAETLAHQSWVSAQGDATFLIEDSDLRAFYSKTIGEIAHSHWWPADRAGNEFAEDLGAYPTRTMSQINRVKIACLLRIADALHLDQRRAPRFLRTLTRPTGHSALHWTFQERLSFPHVEHEAIKFTSGSPFSRDESDAWWLAYDTLMDVDKELREVDLVLQNKGLYFAAKRVKGAGSPEGVSKMIATAGWRPVDTQLRVSDIPKVVETLGGAQLYGDDPTIVLRELIQNAADAIQARRLYDDRDADWGMITVSLGVPKGFVTRNADFIGCFLNPRDKTRAR